MNKKESSIILLACKKHGIFLTTRNEGDKYLVTFLNRLEIRSFEAAKHITNGLVVERKQSTNKITSKQDSTTRLRSINSSNRKTREINDITFEERITARNDP